MTTPAPESREIATTLDGRDITRGYVSPLRLELPDDSVLLARGAGDYSLYREVLRDDHVKAALTQRVHAVIARPWEVRPGGARAIDRAAAHFLQEQIARLRWDAITAAMLHGVFYGFAVAEALWGADGRHVTLDAIKVRDRRRFGFDGAGRLRLKTTAQPEGELLPERKFWHFCTGSDHDDAPYGLGLAHWLYWPVWLKRNGLRFWATFLERFGTPTATGRFPAGATPDEQAKLLAALQAIQRDSAIIFPEGMAVELLEAKRAGSADHADFVSMMNAAILVITIGQTASTQGTPGKLGNDQTQNEVRRDIVMADADLVCSSFNSSIARWLTEFNFPGAATPQVWRVLDDPADLNASAERDERLARIGYRPGAARIAEVYGEGYEAAPPATPPSPASGSGAGGEGDASFAAEEPQPAQLIAARLEAEAAPHVGQWVDRLQAMLDAAGSLEELREMILAAFADLPSAGLAGVLAQAEVAAHAAGRYDIEQAAGDA